MKPVTLWRAHESYFIWLKNRPFKYPCPVEYRALPRPDFDALVKLLEDARPYVERSVFGYEGTSAPSVVLLDRIDTALREALAAGGK